MRQSDLTENSLKGTVFTGKENFFPGEYNKEPALIWLYLFT